MLSHFYFSLNSIINFSSRFLYLPPIPAHSETAADIFCSIIWTAQFAFQMGYISIFTCVSLTIERWVAVVKPNAHRSFKSKHAVATVLIVWFLGIIVNSSTYFRVEYSADKNLCEWTSYSFATKEIPWIDFTVQSAIPYTIMIVLYTHIHFRIKNLPQISSNRDCQLKKITTVALLACSALILGWLPGRITFLLSKFGYFDANSVLHNTFLLLTFSNSCVNPWLYGIYNPTFRTEYKTCFKKARKLCRASATVPSSSVEVLPKRQNSANKSTAQRSLPLQLNLTETPDV